MVTKPGPENSGAVGRELLKVFSPCLQELVEGDQVVEMSEGYRAMAKEMKRFAATALNIENEVMQEWN